MDKNEIDWIVPSPKSVKINEGSSWKIPVTLSCIIPSEFAALENPLTLLFRQQKLIPVDFVSDNESIEVKKVNGLGPEAYHLYLNPEKITIEAGDQAGAFYAFQSLAQLLFHAHEEGLAEIPAMIVEDAPRFSYRGMHFDIGRNYFGPAKIKQLMDFMALFKMNKFHFNITEDEGWRIEIPSLPELTEVGAKRGYTPDESDRLNPAYGSGGNGDNPRGSGYFTRAEYIDLIKYADERHIEIIPEINAPGHARAAIVSMRARYNKYLAQGDEAKAKEFMLHDPDDKSEYRSAQQYDDNVICVCQESSFNFIFKVIDEIAKMYDEAGVKMKMYHTGGDELPYGAWQKSPICADFLASHPEVDGTNDLHAYFMRRVIDYVRPKGLAIGGWEEIVLEHGPDGHNGTDINTSFVSNDIVPYVWNATWGSGREDMVYRLANVGYDVVMANSSSFYFDMTTDKDLDNYGLDWSGYTSYKDAWSTEPLDIFKKPRGIDPAQNNTQERVRLQPTARKHFLGIQGQMWTETVRSEAILDELMMPNLPIFAERAWAEPSSWAAESSNEEIEWALDKDWNQFANTIGQRAIHLTGSLFGGTQYDLPKPGAIIENGKLKANTMFPGQEIRYTLDGSLPDANSPIYEGEPEVPAGSKVVLRTFDRNGRGGRPIRVDQ
jgi:hexosaminidase